jgi:hypothetical protein
MDTKPCEVTKKGKACEEPTELDTVTLSDPAEFHADCGTSTVKEVAVGVVVGVSVEPKPLTTVSDVKFVPVIVTGIIHVLPTIAIGGERRAMDGASPDGGGGGGVPPPEGLDGVCRLQPASTSINITTENSFVFIVTFWGRGY